MKEIRQIVEAFGQIDFKKNKAALATVARVEGSSYRRTGARMLVLDNGTYLGGISGGCLEGDALRRAQKAIAANQPSVVTYDTTRDDHHQIGIGLGCNGIIDVLFTPLNPEAPQNPITFLRKRMHDRQLNLLATISGGIPSVLGHVIPYENDTQWYQDFPIHALAATVLTDVKQCLQSATTQTNLYPLKDEQEVRICLEVLVPSTHLVLCGANNDIYPLARIGHELGWDITVLANPLKMDKTLFTIAKVVHPDDPQGPEIDAWTAILLMSHDFKTDLKNFRRFRQSPARYIGMLGPRKRAEKIFNEIGESEKPVSDMEKERIFAPAGLDIGALTPEEIALSIAAEIRAYFASRSGASLRLRPTTIHAHSFHPEKNTSDAV